MKKKLFSLAFGLLFILNSIISQSISKFEYFIDADPGVGFGVSFFPAVSDSVTVIIPVSITGIPVGSHTLGVRSMDVNGVWSHAEFRTFFINSLADNSNQQLVMAEFYLGETDPGVGLAFPVLVSNPADSVTIIADTVLNNLPIGQYKINLRFKDGRGVWSHQESRIFSICSTYGAQSEMNYQIEGNKVFFTSNSLYYDTISWRFGDNTIDTVTNPIKTYTNAGVYNVQLITENNCGIDTLPTSIEIRGMQRISPQRTGNGGVTTVSFNGFGFLPGTEVKLIRGATVLTPIQKYFHSSGNIKAYFNLTSQSTGMYHAVAVLGSAFDTLFNALQVENPDPVIVSVSISGPKASRVQTMRRYSNIFNYSNQDAIMVPYASEIGKAPQFSYTVQYDTFADMLFLNNKGIFQNTYQYLSSNSIPLEVMEAKDIDTVRKKELLAYYKIRIPAASYATDMIKIANNTSITYSHGALVQPPLFSSSIVVDSLQSDFRVCMNSFLKKAVKKNLAVVINDAAWNSCFDNAFDTLAKTIRDIAKQLAFQKQSIPMKAVYAALLSEISLCGTSGMPSSLDGNIFKQIVKDVTYNWLFFEDLDSLGGPCFDTTMTLTANRSNSNANDKLQRVSMTEDEDCPGAIFAPELAEECKIFTKPCDQLGKLGEIDNMLEYIGLDKVFEKFTAPFDKFCKVNSASVSCEKLCELTSLDPNGKFGPGDNNLQKYVNHIRDANYTIMFENVSSASAPAAYVEIRDTIDKTVFDINTIQTGVLGWGDSLVFMESNRSSISLLRDLRPLRPNMLRIDVEVDTLAGIITWKFWTVDTIKLQLTTDPSKGFLPPNTDGVSGLGFVTFTIKPKAGVTSGSVLTNKATIVFDQNAPIMTPLWEYRIDTIRPQSQVSPLSAITNTSSFLVSWSGTDSHSGINEYSVFVSKDDSLYKQWKSLTTSTADTFHGEFGHSYKFFSVALDKAGNFEEAPNNPILNPDAVTNIQVALPLNLISFIAKKTLDSKKVDLTWKTTHELNVSHFEIQRRINGNDFITIGRIRATNNFNGASYIWQDSSPLPGDNYYRLRMVDIDSSVKFSAIRSVKFLEENEIKVFPTVTSDLLFIQTDKLVIADLFDGTGKKLISKNISGNASIDMRVYPAGIYFIRISEKNKVFKIVKQ